MFKAIHTPDNQDIIILDPAWEDTNKLDALRDLGRGDLLICQECRQPVYVRAGAVRRWNFAHKHRKNCIRAQDSLELLQARSVLYTWLVEKCGADNVELEKKLDGANLPRPIDCYVRGPGGLLAYWLIDKALRPLDRETLQEQFQQLTMSVQYVFLTTMLPELADNTEHFILTTTERELQMRSRYDALYEAQPGWGRSLHYLDPINAFVITYRGLNLIHPPATFAAHTLAHPLAELQILPKTGEFVHPAEQASLETYRAAQKAQAARPMDIPPYEPQTRLPVARSETSMDERMGTCSVCGQQTIDWVTYNGVTKGCVCRVCHYGGQA